MIYFYFRGLSPWSLGSVALGLWQLYIMAEEPSYFAVARRRKQRQEEEKKRARIPSNDKSPMTHLPPYRSYLLEVLPPLNGTLGCRPGP